ncbi:hypothetical protein FIBSPDRAFT_115788 [Athelia psychrophila]|uniref:Uncharacterized protein n=1 Tax=Athelia psychrophila TaxID=1759441 RepID=A0A166CZA8_9AGAM|nr:hypothetical protein FIBSPDRAFT_115788 [Fibularhizoctonia sp. CBS 109695]
MYVFRNPEELPEFAHGYKQILIYEPSYKAEFEKLKGDTPVLGDLLRDRSLVSGGAHERLWKPQARLPLPPIYLLTAIKYD